jgi:hypothetical protein
VRTTLTLDDDVATKVHEAMRQTGASFKDTVNGLLRLALNTAKRSRTVEPFVVRARPMGVKPGLDYDRISALIEELEGPDHR